MLSRKTTSNGLRLTGFARYTEVLERNIKSFLLANLFTVIGFIPFVTGVAYALLSSSFLVLLAACTIGGMIAGPFLICMYDTIFRGLRDAPGKFLDNYKRAFKQNWRQGLIPGIVFCLMLGIYAFMLMLFSISTHFPGWGTIAVYIFSMLIFTMVFSIYWPQVALFDQINIQRIRNCLLFIISFFGKTFGVTLLQLAYWLVIALFLPWSLFLMPLIGFWFILYTYSFILYDTLNINFHIEEQIEQNFPDQVPFYEDDAAWLARKQKEAQDVTEPYNR